MVFVEYTNTFYGVDWILLENSQGMECYYQNISSVDSFEPGDEVIVSMKYSIGIPTGSLINIEKK
jgi:hypothetical protein